MTQLNNIQKLATGSRIAPTVVKKSPAQPQSHTDGAPSVKDSFSMGTLESHGGNRSNQSLSLHERLEKKKKDREKELDQAVEKKLQALKEGPKSNAPSTLPTIFEDGLLGPVKTPSMGHSAPPLCGSGNPMGDTFGSSYGSSAGDSDFSLPEDQGQIAEQREQIQREVQQQKSELQQKAQEDLQAAQESAQQSAQSALGSAQSSVSSDPEISLQPDPSSDNTYSPEQLEQQVSEAVKDAAVDGQPAAQMRLEEAEAALKAAQGEIAGGAVAKANPTFSNDLGVLMEQFSRSDSQVEQSVIHGALDQLLDNAGDGLKEQVEKIRGQLQNMYDQADKAWKAREEAANTAFLSAGSVKSEDSAQRAAGQRADDSTFLKQMVAQRLSNTQNVDGDTLMAALEDKGLM